MFVKSRLSLVRKLSQWPFCLGPTFWDAICGIPFYAQIPLICYIRHGMCFSLEFFLILIKVPHAQFPVKFRTKHAVFTRFRTYQCSTGGLLLHSFNFPLYQASRLCATRMVCFDSSNPAGILVEVEIEHFLPGQSCLLEELRKYTCNDRSRDVRNEITCHSARQLTPILPIMLSCWLLLC